MASFFLEHSVYCSVTDVRLKFCPQHLMSHDIDVFGFAVVEQKVVVQIAHC